VQHFSFCDQVFRRAGYVFNRHVRFDPVLVIQIDAVGSETLQGFLNYFRNALRSAVKKTALFIVEAKFGCDSDSVADRRERLSDKLFVCVGTVEFRCIEERDANESTHVRTQLRLGRTGIEALLLQRTLGRMRATSLDDCIASNKMGASTTVLDTRIVLDLAAIDASMLPQVGGKGANLGELIRAGLPVPLGVCVTTEAYRQVAATATIDFDGLAAAAATDAEAHGRQAREALMAAPLPSGIAETISDAYARLGPDTPVAVRSSATAEDLPGASFAGQQDTYLHIVGRDAVLNAVRRCWASLWT